MSNPPIADDMVERARDALAEHGIHIDLPWEGDLDDVERERYEGLCAALESALSGKEE